MVFGPADVENLIYPTLTLAKSIEFPGTFLERAESFAAILWISIVFVSAILFFYRIVRNISELLNVKPKHQNYVIWGLTPLFFAIAFYFKGGLEVIEFFSRIKTTNVFLGLALFPFITLIAYLKKRKEKGV